MKQRNKTETTDDTLDTKPEPISAKPNWHYDSYFIAQLERLNLRKPEKPKHKRNRGNHKPSDQRVDEVK